MTTPMLGLQLYTVRSSDLPLYQLLAAVAAAGYDGVETVGTQDVAPERLRDALADAGLTLASAHVPLAAFRTDLAALAKVHRTLGTPVLVVPWLAPEDRPTDLTGWRALGRELDGYGRALADEGFALAYHHHDFELAQVDGSDGLTALLEAAAPEHLSLELDTGWWAAVGRDPVAGIHGWGRRVRRLHLKDLVAGQTPPWVDVGDGMLDVAGVLAAAQTHGVPWAIVEHDAPSDPVLTIERSAARVSRVLGRG
jgi:sugar phosphate isomerase/epimerase